MLERFLQRLERVRRDPVRLVDYLRRPRRLVVGGALANRLGLQAGRALKERAVRRLRSLEVAPDLKGPLEALEQTGLLVIENYLPIEDFQELERELERLERLPPERFRIVDYGKNFRSQDLIVSKYPDEFPAFSRILRDDLFLNRLACASARRRPSFKSHVMVQWLSKPEPDQPHEDYDYNSYLHVDRHYQFMKAFLYLRDVPADCAPYTFVPGSHRFSWERLRFEYLLGVRQSAARNVTARLGTLAQKERDAAMSQLAEELCTRGNLKRVAVSGKKNTLIISDNAGLHCRGEMRGRLPRVTANLDFKFLESWGHTFYPVLEKLMPEAMNGSSR